MLVPQGRGLLLSVLNYLIEAMKYYITIILLYNNILNSDITVLIYMKIFYGNTVMYCMVIKYACATR